MKLFQIFKNKKIFLLNIFLTLYVAINLIGGERGIFSYFEKKNIQLGWSSIGNKDVTGFYKDRIDTWKRYFEQ